MGLFDFYISGKQPSLCKTDGTHFDLLLVLDSL